MTDSKEIDPILDPANDRMTALPIKFNDVWGKYKQHEACIWHASDIKIAPDKPQWDALNADQKYFLIMILAFFASSDMIVSENLSERFMREISMTEAKFFYAFQLFIENVHSEVYSNLIETYVDDRDEKNKLFNAITEFNCVRKKANWAKKWITSSDKFSTRLAAFAAVEGIFFSGSFCAIYWIKESGKLNGLCSANEYIARDEGLHTDFACLLYTKYVLKQNRMSVEDFNNMFKEAVEIETEFITEALPCRLIGMNSELMIQYIKFVANRLAIQLGYEKIWDKVENPFDFMDRIALRNKTNFFEQHVSEYQKQTEIVESDKDAYDVFGA